MKKIIPFSMILTLSACTGNNTQTGHNTQQKSCICEKTMETDSVMFATNVTIKDQLNRSVLSFHCADIDLGTASVSDENG